MADASGQHYAEVNYTDTHNDHKQTETIDTSHDPQTTERNLGMISSDSKTNALKNEHEYEKAGAAGTIEDGDTERRHFSSLPGNQAYASSSLQPALDKDSAEKGRPSYLLDSSKRQLNTVDKELIETYEEEKKDEGVIRENAQVAQYD